MQRILVVGSSGAGKTTLAVTLGKTLDLPVFHLDRLFWQPGWQKLPEHQWVQKQRELTAGERWIIDGTYDSTLQIRIPRADTIIHLEYPRWLCMWRATRRIMTTYGRVRPDMAPGCPERFDLGFIKWVWRYHTDITPNILSYMRQAPTVEQITLRNPRETQAFLTRIRNNR